MADRTWRHNGPRLVLGLIVIGLGILFTLDKLGYVDAGRYWDYWPILLIAAGLGRVLQPRACHGRGFGVVLIVVGALFLASNFDLLPYRVWDLWPLLLVIIGGSMVWRAMGRSSRGWSRRPPTVVGFAAGAREGGAPDDAAGPVQAPSGTPPPDGGADASSTVDCFSLLGASHRRSVSQDFRGGSMFAMLGGCELDLREASIRSGQAVIDAFAMWGGIEIKVPPDWTVALHGTPILGGFDDKTTRTGGDGSKVLVVTGTAIMGGVEIKN
ncbi:MAG TPA: DUF5668 domain-containing protein [Thermoanaerobaculaceae bacterium]|nr:DUF5668 domain-containing protein [Thermoanaerobaculaceae bacterium]